MGGQPPTRLGLPLLRLIAVPSPEGAKNLWNLPNALLEKFPADRFTVTTKLTFTARAEGESTGLVVLGQSYASVSLRNTASGLLLEQTDCPDARDSKKLITTPIPITTTTVYLRATVDLGAIVHYSYSLDGDHFTPLGTPFQATAGRWVGTRIGLYALGIGHTYEHGYADVDWFRSTPQ